MSILVGAGEGKADPSKKPEKENPDSGECSLEDRKINFENEMVVIATYSRGQEVWPRA